MNAGLLSFQALYLLFPAVLALHNLDEYSSSKPRAPHTRLSWSSRHFQSEVTRLAMILLTLASVVVAVLNYARRDSMLTIVAELSVFALLFNAIVHLTLSLIARSFTPGTRSALILVLPYSLVTIAAIHHGAGHSSAALWPLVLGGLIALPVTILLTLAVARCLYWFIAGR
jgi:hypothetical protein